MTLESIKLDPYGVVKDTNPIDVGEEWTDVSNMRFRNNSANKFRGEVKLTDTTDQGLQLQFNGDHSDPRWYIMADGSIHSYDGTEHDIDTADNVTSSKDWQSCLFNLVPIFNNTVDKPWTTTVNNQVTELPGFLVDSCQVIRPFRSFLIAMNTTEGATRQPNRFIWSDSSDAGALPPSWDIADPTTLAGDAYLTSSRGEIIDGLQLRDNFILYKSHSTYLMSLVGGQSVMSIRKIQIESGILAKDCVKEFEGKHFIVTDGDIVVFDGMNIQSVAEKRVRDKIFGSISSEFFFNAYVTRYDVTDEMWFCYPETGREYPNVAAVWSFKDNVWTFRTLGYAPHMANGVATFGGSPFWNDAVGVWNDYVGNWQPLATNPTVDTLVRIDTTALNVIDETNDIVGVPLSSSLEKASMDLGDAHRVKFVNKVVPQITAPAGTKVYVRIGVQMEPDSNIDWKDEQLYTVGQDHHVNVLGKGRYISVKLRTQDLDTTWSCHGLQLYFRGAGNE